MPDMFIGTKNIFGLAKSNSLKKIFFGFMNDFFLDNLEDYRPTWVSTARKAERLRWRRSWARLRNAKPDMRTKEVGDVI